MSEQSFLAGIIIFGIVIIILAYKIKKLEEKIEKVEIGDDDNA